MTIAVTLLLVGIFALLLANMEELLARFGADLHVTACLDEGSTPTQSARWCGRATRRGRREACSPPRRRRSSASARGSGGAARSLTRSGEPAARLARARRSRRSAARPRAARARRRARRAPGRRRDRAGRGLGRGLRPRDRARAARPGARRRPGARDAADRREHDPPRRLRAARRDRDPVAGRRQPHLRRVPFLLEGLAAGRCSAGALALACSTRSSAWRCRGFECGLQLFLGFADAPFLRAARAGGARGRAARARAGRARPRRSCGAGGE